MKVAGQYQRKYGEMQIYDKIAECYHELKDYKNESLYLDKSKRLNTSIDIDEKATAGEVLKHATKNEIGESSFLNPTKLYYLIAIPFLIVILIIILRRKTTQSNIIDVITEKPAGSEDENEAEKLNHETLNLLINLAEDDDPSFYFKFNDVFPDFSENLLKINPKLTQSDLEYCAMMKLNFDTKKIASIKRLSIGAVESKKYRIRKKLDISTEENIYIWLMDK
ncbi:helix-turn-helix transcriptional regulator [Elizabethkingia anophelis]